VLPEIITDSSLRIGESHLPAIIVSIIAPTKMVSNYWSEKLNYSL
jgi:hypothetical protein